MNLRFGSVCSGIEAASTAWEPLGWKPVFFSEIEKHPSNVLRYHWPDVPNLEDFTTIDGKAWDIDVLVGGTPCQAFSVAGRRQSLEDDRGNLTLKFVELVHESDVPVVVWENVPGVLNTSDNAFGCFLGGLVGTDRALIPLKDGGWPGYGMVAGPRRIVAWRLLDAQYFGVAQRRRRLFLVSFRAGDGRNPGAVLFEPESVPRDTPPSRETGESVAPTVTSGPPFSRTGNSRVECDALVPQLYSMMPQNSGKDFKARRVDVAQPLMGSGPVGGNQGGDVIVMAHGQGNAEICAGKAPCLSCNHEAPIAFNWQNAGNDGLAITVDGTGPLDCSQTKAIVFDTTQMTSKANYSNPKPGDPCHPLAAGAHPPAIAFNGDQSEHTRSMGESINQSPTLRSGGMVDVMTPAMQVRRLTPIECERLQGFPDNHTLFAVDEAGRQYLVSNGARYKALGNSMAVPCMAWIGRRIEMVLEATEYSKSGDKKE